jgi:putative spermidine/putrescine transport system permease protein
MIRKSVQRFSEEIIAQTISQSPSAAADHQSAVSFRSACCTASTRSNAISDGLRCGGNTAATLLFAVPAALAIPRYRFPGREALSALFLSPLMIPHVVLGIAFLRFFTWIGIGGTFAALVIAHVVVVFPFALRLTLAAATDMDRSVEMAAISLGAGGWTLFRRVTLPAILPGIVSGWALAFIQSFDDLTMTVFLAAPATETLPVRMFLYIQDNIDPLVTSVSASVIAITMTVLVLLDRFFGLERVLTARGEQGR